MLGLSRIVNAVEALQPSTRGSAVTVLPERCTRYRHRASLCSCCIEACPCRALSLSDNRLTLSASVCKECGACASACPTGAIEIKNPTDKDLVELIAARATPPGHVTLACKNADPTSSESIPMTCLARLDPSLLLLAFARGASQVSLISGECSKCEMGSNLAHLQHTIATAENLAAMVGAHVRVSIQTRARTAVSVSVPRGEGVSRRSFLAMFGKGGVGYTAEAATALIAMAPPEIDHEIKREPLVAYLPEKHKRLVECWRALAANTQGARGASAVFFAPQIDAIRCVGCGMCSDLCPTGALAAEPQVSMFRITCDVSACVACKLCVDLCNVHAVSLCPRRENLLTIKRTSLLERPDNNDLHASFEDKMSRLLGTNLYRT